LKKSLPQLKRVRITLHLKFCALLIQQNIPPNYLKNKQILKMGSKEKNINVPAGQGDELNCKKTTLIISKKRKKQSSKNHTILSTYQELIKQERQKTKKTYPHYTCTELHTCFETFVMIINLHSVLQFSNYYTYLLLLLLY